MSELLDRVRREIRERLESTRAAVFEYERLEAALHALGDAGSRATRAVRGGGRGSRAPGAAESSRTAGKPSTRARTSKRPAATSSTARRGARARARAASASPRPRKAAGGRERSRPSASSRAPSTRAKKSTPVPADAATPARGRTPRGANREAVLRVVGERPGVTARELAAASQVTGGTLYTLLRRLTDDGTLEKRELPGGQAGYALATGARSAAQPAPAQPQAATTEARSGVETGAAERPQRDRAESTQNERSAPTEKQPR